MHLKHLLLLAAALALTACEVTLSEPAASTPTPAFVTATLPPTRTPFGNFTATPHSRVTGTPGTAVSPAASCKDTAVLLQDVTIPDGTNVAYGAKFTKTWQFRNTGTCQWSDYSIAFVSGDRMGASDSAPVPTTQPKADVNVSIVLTAPVTDGIYTGFYELRNKSGAAVPIGIEKTFWVKITVGNATVPTGQAQTTPLPTIGGTVIAPKPPGSCVYTTSGSYPSEIVQLINQARADAGLPALTVNAQLASAAQSHSINMACYSLLSHTGYDGSTIQQRAAAAGYSGGANEIIYGGYGAYPQTAFDWWMNDAIHRAEILRTNVTQIGAGYAYVEDSAHGNYYTVDFGN